MTLLNLALAPTLIILIYIYIRDKYEKEPIKLLLIGTLYGVIISFPIILTENIIMSLVNLTIQRNNFFRAFFIASFVEEFYKFIFIYFFIWKNKEFNEPLDGIVYSVFLSLGFAGIENILYVFNPTLGGFKTAIGRALLSVPTHFLFSVFMGYYFSCSKFLNIKFSRLKAYFIPFFLHGLYDLILLSTFDYKVLVLVILIIYLWISSLKKMKNLLDLSPFKNS